MMNLDWLRVAVSEAKLVIRQRGFPRIWTIQVPYQHVFHDDTVKGRFFGYNIEENAALKGRSLKVRRLSIRTRLNQARLKLYQEVEHATETGWIGNMEFKLALPLEVKYVGKEQKVRVRKAMQAIGRDCEVIQPTPGKEAEQRWALKHKPTGCVVFFDLDPKAGESAEDSMRRAARIAIDRMEAALAERDKGVTDGAV